MSLKNKYRKKSKIERFFSLSHHKKKQGSKKISSDLNDIDYERLKQERISILDNSNYQYKYFKSLDEHLTYLRKEFNGESQLIFYHAKLIVLIRRDVMVKENFERFVNLWKEQRSYLLDNLSLRWIISAVDTFLDFSQDDALKSSLLCALALVNTCKIYETERLLVEGDRKHKSISDYQLTAIDKVLDDGSTGTVMLFDGIPSFRINKSDTLNNMRRRMEITLKTQPLAYAIVMEVFGRLQKSNTAYHRFAANHHHTRTQWW